MSATIFARIIQREIPAAIVYEDELTIAFMDAGQINPGHVIVATKAHVETILDLDDEAAGALFRTAARIARAVEAAFHPDGITVLQTNRPAGWQTVPHVHLHVLPRHDGDGVTLGWPRKEPSFTELQSLASRLTGSYSPNHRRTIETASRQILISETSGMSATESQPRAHLLQ